MYVVLVSIVVSIPACHAGDRGSIPRRGDNLFFSFLGFITTVKEVMRSYDSVCVSVRRCVCEQDHSKTSARIRMKFAENSCIGERKKPDTFGGDWLSKTTSAIEKPYLYITV